MPKRKERIAPPPKTAGWDFRYANNDAVKGWVGSPDQSVTTVVLGQVSEVVHAPEHTATRRLGERTVTHFQDLLGNEIDRHPDRSEHVRLAVSPIGRHRRQWGIALEAP